MPWGSDAGQGFRSGPANPGFRPWQSASWRPGWNELSEDYLAYIREHKDDEVEDDHDLVQVKRHKKRWWQ